MIRQFHRISTFQQSRRRTSIRVLKEKFLVLESNCWRLTDEHQLAMLNTDDLRLRNREQLIENLERVIQEKNASINKLEERLVSSDDLSHLLNKRIDFSSDQLLNETLHQRNVEFHLLEERLKQYEEKVISIRRHLSCFFVFSCNVTKIILDMYIRTIAPFASANLWKDDTRLSTWEWTCVSRVFDVLFSIQINPRLVWTCQRFNEWTTRENISWFHQQREDSGRLLDILLLANDRSLLLARHLIGLWRIFDFGERNSMHTKRPSSSMKRPYLVWGRSSVLLGIRRADTCFLSSSRKEISDLQRQKQTSE